MIKEYDLAVIGAGSGGLVAATSAKRAGLKVALLEKNKIGGECLHTGCVPSKTFIHSAKLYASINKTIHYGLPLFKENSEFDFSQVMEHVDGVVKYIYKDENPEVFQQMGIDVFVHDSGAKFINSKEIQIGGDLIKAEHTIICTGSSPKRVNLPGNKNIKTLDNENFWEIRKLPKNILFIGGGIISAELGQSLRRFGSNVTIVEHNERILKAVDKETAQIAVDKFLEEGIEIITNAEVDFCKEKNNCAEVNIRTKSGDTVTNKFDAVFFAAGRAPNVYGMELENAGVDYDTPGIKTNEYFQTSAKNIYACGDVTSKFKFTHAASMQADICIQNILEGNNRQMDENLVPWAIFTDPEIAHTGLSEEQAKKIFSKINVFRVNATIDRFIAEGKTDGFLKVIFDDKNNIVGADAVGANAGEWIQIITVAVKNKIPLESITDTIFIYPTFSEIVKKAFTRFSRTLTNK